MKRFRRVMTWLMGLTLLGLLAAGVAALVLTSLPGPRQDDPAPRSVDQLRKDLASPDPRVREDAAKKLARLAGEGAEK